MPQREREIDRLSNTEISAPKALWKIHMESKEIAFATEV